MGKYKEYENEKRKNPALKPSIYCKVNLKYKDVKSYDFVKKYFSEMEVLLNALHEYQRISKVHKDEMCIWDLLNKKHGE